MLQRNVEELRIRAIAGPEMSVQMMTLHEIVCCTRRCTLLTVQEKYDAMYHFFHECVENIYLLARESLFLVHDRTDYLEGRISTEPYPLYVCVPVRPESAPEGAVRFPSCKALSVLFYGDYNRLDEAWLRFGREAKERGLVPAALPRGIAIVAPYTGREINPGKYCSRLVMPVVEN
ncbi:MAG: hypothetical protein HDQ98_13715 [Lachnospiraceae bacterium]|nr:hypothetical protein [Lachnospiraceae bacterium]